MGHALVGVAYRAHAARLAVQRPVAPAAPGSPLPAAGAQHFGVDVVVEDLGLQSAAEIAFVAAEDLFGRIARDARIRLVDGRDPARIVRFCKIRL